MPIVIGFVALSSVVSLIILLLYLLTSGTTEKELKVASIISSREHQGELLKATKMIPLRSTPKCMPPAVWKDTWVIVSIPEDMALLHVMRPRKLIIREYHLRQPKLGKSEEKEGITTESEPRETVLAEIIRWWWTHFQIQD